MLNIVNTVAMSKIIERNKLRTSVAAREETKRKYPWEGDDF